MPARRFAVLLLAALPACAIGGDPQDRSLARQKDPVAAQALIGAVFFDDLDFSRTNPSDPTETVYLRADKRLPYGEILLVMDKIRSAGITRVALVTVPLDSAER